MEIEGKLDLLHSIKTLKMQNAYLQFLFHILNAASAIKFKKNSSKTIYYLSDVKCNIEIFTVQNNLLLKTFI